MLEECDGPSYDANQTGTYEQRWMTWHPGFVEFAGNLLTSVELPKYVALTAVRGCEPYEASYDISLNQVSSATRQELLAWCRKLLHIKPSSRMYLLTRMLSIGGPGRTARRLFALVRRGVVELAGKEHSCLYSPVTSTKRDAGFPLHSDRFSTSRLFLVFDDVDNSEAGASIFLSRAELLRTLRRNEVFARNRHQTISRLMQNSPRRDCFDQLFTALYPQANEYNAVIKEQIRIRFRSGEGYLLDDRYWLHGREAYLRPIGKFRFHRLTF